MDECKPLGEGVPQSLAQAVEWYRQAAVQGGAVQVDSIKTRVEIAPGFSA